MIRGSPNVSRSVLEVVKIVRSSQMRGRQIFQNSSGLISDPTRLTTVHIGPLLMVVRNVWELQSARTHDASPSGVGRHRNTNPSPLFAVQSRRLVESQGTRASNASLLKCMIGKEAQTQASYIWITTPRSVPNHFVTCILVFSLTVSTCSTSWSAMCLLSLIEANEWHECAAPSSGPKSHKVRSDKHICHFSVPDMLPQIKDNPG